MANAFWDAANNAFAMGQSTMQAYRDNVARDSAAAALKTGGYDAAAKAYAGAGDYATATQAIGLANDQRATQTAQAQAQRDAITRQVGVTVNGLQALRQLPPEQRQDAFRQNIAPVWQQHGMPQAAIDGMSAHPLDDAFIDSEITALGAKAHDYGFENVGGDLIRSDKIGGTAQPAYIGAVKPDHFATKPDENVYATAGTPGHVPGAPGAVAPAGPGAPTPAAPAQAPTAAPAGAAPPAPQQVRLDPHAFFNQFVAPHEGELNPHDANGAPTNFGINQTANPGVDVTKLTKDQAAQIFADKYFAQSGAANLPAGLAAVQADTYFINPTKANQILQQSGGDPQRYMDLRDAWMQSLVARDPQRFGPYAHAWANRNRDLRAYASSQEAGGAPQGQAGTAQDSAPPPPQTLPGGFQLVQHGAAGPEGHPSTAAELKAAHLPEGAAAWTGKDGKPVPYPEAFQPPAPPSPNSGLTGEDFLKTLPVGYASQLRSYANGDLALPTGSRAGRPEQQKLLDDIMQYDPTASAANLPSRVATRKAFTSGAYSQTVNATNTVIGHIGDLDHAIDNLHNTGLDWVNGPAQWAGQHFGNSDTQKAVADFNTYKTMVANELTKVYRGTGGAEADIQGWMHQMDSASSPAGLHATVKAMVTGLKSRLDALGMTYSQGMGKVTDPMTFLTGKSQQTLGRIQPEDFGPAGATAPAAGVPAPSAVNLPAPVLHTYRDMQAKGELDTTVPTGSSQKHPGVAETQEKVAALPNGYYYVDADGNIRQRHR